MNILCVACASFLFLAGNVLYSAFVFVYAYASKGLEGGSWGISFYDS